MIFKRISALLFIITLLTSLLPPHSAVQAAEWEEEVGGVSFPSGVVLYDGEPSPNSFISGYETVIPNDVSITRSNPIIGVELRNAAGEVKGTMTNTGGSNYRLDTPITGYELSVSSKDKVALMDAPFEWFRDPAVKTLWMYDANDKPAVGEDPLTDTPIRRHYLKAATTVADRPPAEMCAYTTRSIDDIATLPSSYPDTAPCNEANLERSGTLNVNSSNGFLFDAARDSLVIAVDQVSGITFDLDKANFNPGSDKNLKIGNIKGFEPALVDPSNWHFRFDYTIVFNVEPDEVIQNNSHPDGRVIQYWDNWEIPLKGHVYKHDKLKLFVLTADPTAKTDVTVPSLTGPSCIEAGLPRTYKYTIANSGPPTSSSFKVLVSSEGTEIVIHTVNGIGNTPIEGTFDYTFTEAGTRSITILANSDDSLDEESTGNNSKTVSFTAVAACGPGPDPDPGECSLGAACSGDWTGTLSVHHPSIEWKNPNDFNVTIINPNNGCSAVQGRFKVSQGSSQYIYGWTNIVGNTDTTGFAWGMGGSSTYPGSIGQGFVQVIYDVEDSCGRTSIIGPETFEINKWPGAPTVEVDWYKSSTNTTTVEVIQNENVFVKATATDSKDEDVTLSWTFTGSTSWLAGLPASMGWSSPLNKVQYNNITAAEKGSHKVCVTATNESGVSDSACSTLFVNGPEPIAIIDVGGWLKEGRRIELSGEQSSSPKGSALTYAWALAPVAGQTAGTQADIQYIAPLSGKLKDFKTPKHGKYQVTLIVTDTEGLTGSATRIVDVAPDLPPIVDLVGNTTTTRQLPDGGLGTFTLLGTGLSVDQDIISHRYWSFT